MCHVIYTDLEALRVAAARAAAPVVGERRERHDDRRVGRRGGLPVARAGLERRLERDDPLFRRTT